MCIHINTFVRYGCKPNDAILLLQQNLLFSYNLETVNNYFIQGTDKMFKWLMFSHSFHFPFFPKSCENYGQKKNTSTNNSFSLSLVKIHIQIFSHPMMSFKSQNYVFESSLFIFCKLEYEYLYFIHVCALGSEFRCPHCNSYNNNNHLSVWRNIAFEWKNIYYTPEELKSTK